MQIAPTQTTITTLASILCLSLLFCACDGCERPGYEEQPWRFVSDAANYELIFPPQWKVEPTGSINANADIEASRDDTYFLMIIAHEVPDFPRPDVHRLKRAGLQTLDSAVDELLIERQGPLKLGEVSGLTVFATGHLDDQDISYIATYAVHDGFGYQIIAFSDAEYKTELFDEMDSVLAQWQFTDDEATPDAEETDDDSR